MDYEMLQEAHEMCQRLAKVKKTKFSIQVEFSMDGSAPKFKLYHGETNFNIYLLVDEVIEELIYLTRSINKFESGQKVWLMDCDCICTAIFERYEFDGSCRIKCCNPMDNSLATGPDLVEEDELFASLADLVDDQAEYWMNMKLSLMHDKDLKHMEVNG